MLHGGHNLPPFPAVAGRQDHSINSEPACHRLANVPMAYTCRIKRSSRTHTQTRTHAHPHTHTQTDTNTHTHTYIYIYIYIYGTPPPVPRLCGCVLFQSDALTLMFVCVPSSLRLWESRFSFTMAPEASKCSVYCICAPELSPNFMERAGNVGKTNIFQDLSVGNHGNCWLYQHFQQFS